MEVSNDVELLQRQVWLAHRADPQAEDVMGARVGGVANERPYDPVIDELSCTGPSTHSQQPGPVGGCETVDRLHVRPDDDLLLELLRQSTSGRGTGLWFVYRPGEDRVQRLADGHQIHVGGDEAESGQCLHQRCGHHQVRRWLDRFEKGHQPVTIGPVLIAAASALTEEENLAS